jgi:hypothetical protein
MTACPCLVQLSHPGRAAPDTDRVHSRRPGPKPPARREQEREQRPNDLTLVQPRNAGRAAPRTDQDSAPAGPHPSTLSADRQQGRSEEHAVTGSTGVESAHPAIRQAHYSTTALTRVALIAVRIDAIVARCAPIKCLRMYAS